MSKTKQPESPAPDETTGSLIPLERVNLPAMFASGEGLDAFLAEMRKHTADIVPDLTTEKGRKEIRSLAYRVTRTKTMVDEAGKAFTEQRRAELKAIDANRAKIRDSLDALRDEVRKPVDEWQAAEDARIEAELEQARAEAAAREAAEAFEREVSRRIEVIAGLPASFVGVDLLEAERMRADIAGKMLGADMYGDRLAEAEAERTAALAKIDGLLEMQRKMAKLEAEAEERRQAEAERERLRAEAEEREARRRAEEIERERQRRHELEQKINGIQTRYLLNASSATAARVEKLIEQLDVEAGKIGANEYDELVDRALESAATTRGKLCKILTQRVEAEAAERERQAAIAELEVQKAEADRIRREYEERERAEQARKEAEAAEQAKREREAAKASHRKRIRAEAAAWFTAYGIAAGDAAEIVAAIEGGEVAHVSIQF